MEMKSFRYSFFLKSIFVVIIVCISGCDLFLPSLSVNRVNSIQQSLIDKGPQAREDKGLSLLNTPKNSVESLVVEVDEKTGKKTIKLKLNDAVVRAIAFNTDIGVAAYQPAIAYEAVVRETAAFDPTISASMGYNSNDNPVNLTGTIPKRKTRTMSVGVSQRLVSGAEWSLTNDMTRLWDSSQLDDTDRYYLNDLNMQIVQPLLRNAGRDVNLAQIRVASLDHETSLSQFRQQIEKTISEVSTAYYQLIQARGTVTISEDLLGYASETLQRVIDRKDIDATIVTIKQAEAAVEQRRAVLAESHKTASDVRDQLARLIPGANLNTIDNFEFVPLDQLSGTQIKIDLADRILTALSENPTMEQVRLALKRSQISIDVSENGLLPSLNLQAGATIHGASTKSRNQTWDDFSDGKYASYFAQLNFEYTLGNRAAESRLAESRYRKLQTITQLQNIADTVSQRVKESVRSVETSYITYLAYQKSVKAYENQLKGLKDLEEKRESLTPEFLNLKLNTQQELGRAKINELSAKTQYNVALVNLDLICGVLLKRHQVELALPESK